MIFKAGFFTPNNVFLENDQVFENAPSRNAVLSGIDCQKTHNALFKAAAASSVQHSGVMCQAERGVAG